MRRPGRRYRWFLVGWFAVFGLVIVGIATPPRVAASTISRYSAGYSGTFTGQGVWLWSGTVLAGETAYMTASGDANGGTAGFNVGWSCQGYGDVFGHDYIGSRAWVVAPGPLASATLHKLDQSRFCSFYLQPEDLPGNHIRVHVYSSSVRLDHDSGYVTPVGPDSPAPSGTATPSPTPSSSFYAGPTPTPSGSPVCFGPDPSTGSSAAPVVSACPTPTPSPTPTATPPPLTWSCNWYDGSLVEGGGQRGCADYTPTINVVIGGHVEWDWSLTVSGLDGNAPGRSVQVSLCQSFNGSNGSICMATTTTGVAGGSSALCQSGTGVCSGHMDGSGYGGFGANSTELLVCHNTDWYYTTTCAATAHNFDASGHEIGLDGSPLPTPTPTPTPSGSPTGSGGTSDGGGVVCYRTIPNGDTIVMDCPESSGAPGTGSGGTGNVCTGSVCVGGGGGACQPGPVTAICKPGMGTYGNGGDCPFPGLSLNPLDYLGWIGCEIGDVITALTNLPQYIVNALIDLVSPAPGLDARVGAHLAALESARPFSYVGDLVTAVDAGTGASAMSIPAIPLPGGGSIAFPLSAMASGMSGVRSVLVGFVWLAAALACIRIVAGSFGTGRAGGGGE